MYIESKANERIKNVVKLRDKQARQDNRLFFFEGVSLLEEYLRHGHIPYALFVSEDANERYFALIDSVGRDKVFVLREDVFKKISTEKAPQGIITVSAFLDNVIFLKDKDDYELLSVQAEGGLLFLDSLQDAGNVGAIIRTAVALGSAECVLGRDCADIYNNKTVRATMGAVFSGRIYIADNLSQAINTVRSSGRRIFAATLGSRTLTLGEFEIKNGDCFVVGNEGNGINTEIIGLCDNAVKIPITNGAESLNASTAAAILLWELKNARVVL